MPTVKRKWTPHPAQAVIMASDVRFRAAPCGRRFGKTEMAHNVVIEYAIENPGSNIWWVAPSYDDANELGFDPLLAKIPNALIDGEPRRRFPRRISLTNGTVISFRTSEREKSLRGRGLDFVVVDESGEVPDNIWQEALRPALSDTEGGALAIGTPKGRNWFHTLYERGQSSGWADHASWRFSTYDNPYIKDQEVEQARETLPERVFRQEYLAEFLADEGDVFGNVRQRNAHGYDLDAARGESPYSIGVDLARQQNFTAIVVLDTHGTLVHFERIRKHSWTVIGSAIERVSNQYRPASVYLDATRDNKLIEDLSRKTNVIPVSFGGGKKNEMIENLAARLELGEIMLSEDADVLLSELETFTYETTPSGNIRYGAKAGKYDDSVDALALAAQNSNVATATW